MGLDICNFSIEAWPILNIHNFNHWKKIQIDRDIFFYIYVRSEKRSDGPIESWDKFELSIVWSVRLRRDISQILCLTFCDIECHKNSLSIRLKVCTFLTSWCFWVTGQIHQSSYQVNKLLMKVQMIGPKAGMNTAHSIYLKFELIEIFNKTRGMLTWAETGEYIRIHYSGYVRLYVSGTQSIWHQIKWLNIIPGI